jgi:hypothetical protein
VVSTGVGVGTSEVIGATMLDKILPAVVVGSLSVVSAAVVVALSESSASRFDAGIDSEVDLRCPLRRTSETRVPWPCPARKKGSKFHIC